MSKRPSEPLPNPRLDAKGSAPIVPVASLSPTKIEGVDLGEAELAVLRILWEIAPATVRDVMNQLHARGKKVAYTTVLTFLSRLEQKGVVVSDKKDQAYVYRPRVSRESVSQSRVRALLDQLYDGAAGPMVLQLVEQAKFTSDELARLRQLIDELDGQPASEPSAPQRVTNASKSKASGGGIAGNGGSGGGGGGSRVRAG